MYPMGIAHFIYLHNYILHLVRWKIVLFQIMQVLILGYIYFLLSKMEDCSILNNASAFTWISRVKSESLN